MSAVPARGDEESSPTSSASRGPKVRERYGVHLQPGIGAEMMAESGACPAPSSTSSPAVDAKAGRRDDEDGSTARSPRSRWKTGTVVAKDEACAAAPPRRSWPGQARLQEGGSSPRATPRSQRRCRGRADDDLGQGPRARADPAGPGATPRCWPPTPGDHADRAHPGHPQALKKSGLSVRDDIGAFEVNEAFAPVPLAGWPRRGADPVRLQSERPGHRHRSPARRVRRPADVLPVPPHEGQRDPVRPADHVRGGGMANATIIERVG